MDAPNSITLKPTPGVVEISEYKFGLITSFNSKSYLKKFFITVEP